MKVVYHDKTRQCSVEDNGNLARGLDSAASKYLCPYCGGGITVQKVGEAWRLHCPQCDSPLHAVASKYTGRSSRVIVVNEPTQKSREDLFG